MSVSMHKSKHSNGHSIHRIEPCTNSAVASVNADNAPTEHLLEIERSAACLPVLTIMWHPQLDRFGQQAPLPAADTALTLNRFTPLFGQPGAAGTPLGHPCISRTPLQLLAARDGSVQLGIPQGRLQCEVNGVACEGEVTLNSEAVGAGVILRLGQVLLCLHTTETLPQPSDAVMPLGVSSAMVRVRRQIAVAAGTDLPVLVLGESGTGKELVAQAVHAGGVRAHRKLVTVNMAAMSESLAAADLFGTVKGAYTGAQAARRGLWSEAHAGTLFLDEIGDTPASVQPMLLRAIETGEFRQVGSNDVQHAHVRVIAATDRVLEGSSFNQPLLRRLEGFVIRTPALRTRREDIGVLVQRLLYDLRVPPDWPAKVPVPVVRALCLHSWPGNVRQLMNVVRRLVVSAQASEWPTVAELFGSESFEPARFAPATATTVPMAVPAVSETTTAEPRAYVSPASIAPAALLDALDRAGWCLRAAAIDLGVSRPSLYNLLDRHPDIRRAQSIPRAEIAAALDQGASNLEVLAVRLRTPRDALRRRLHVLGLGVPAIDPIHPS